MRPVLLLATAAALFTALPQTLRGGATSAAVFPVILAVTFAIVVAGRPTGLCIVAGAIAAFAGALAWPLSPGLGGAILLSLGYLERTTRVRTIRARALHVSLAAASGGAAGALSATYTASPLPVFSVATVLCAVVALAPLLVVADDPRVAFLESAARRLGSPLAPALHDAADLLRASDLCPLDPETAAHVKSSWRSLERLTSARLRLHDSPRSASATLVTGMLDRQITEHVQSLVRAVAAAATVGAAEVGLDDTAMRDVHLRGEVLEEQSRAMVEVRTR